MLLGAPGEVSRWFSCPVPTVGAPGCTRRGVLLVLLSRTNSWCPWVHQERYLVGSPVPYQQLVPLSAPGEVSRWFPCPVPTVGAPGCTRRGVLLVLLPIPKASFPISKVSAPGCTRSGASLVLLPCTKRWCPWVHKEKCLVGSPAHTKS